MAVIAVLAFCVAVSGWRIRKARNQWIKSDFGSQTNAEFMAEVGVDSKAASHVQAIREVLADYSRCLSPDQIVASMPLPAFFAKARDIDGWDWFRLWDSFEKAFGLKPEELEKHLSISTCCSESDMSTTVGEWIESVLPRIEKIPRQANRVDPELLPSGIKGAFQNL